MQDIVTTKSHNRVLSCRTPSTLRRPSGVPAASQDVAAALLPASPWSWAAASEAKPEPGPVWLAGSLIVGGLMMVVLSAFGGVLWQIYIVGDCFHAALVCDPTFLYIFFKGPYFLSFSLIARLIPSTRFRAATD